MLSWNKAYSEEANKKNDMRPSLGTSIGQSDYGLAVWAGAREQGGGGGKGAIAPPTFCLNGMDMSVPPP